MVCELSLSLKSGGCLSRVFTETQQWVYRECTLGIPRKHLRMHLYGRASVEGFRTRLLRGTGMTSAVESPN